MSADFGLELKQNPYDPRVEVTNFKKLEEIYFYYQRAQDKLERLIGVPICKEGCGWCCEHTCISVLPIEAHYAVSVLIGQGQPTDISEVVQRCESWLLERNPRLNLYLGTIPPTLAQCQSLKEQANWLMNSTPCPLLKEKRCLIHAARPLICRAYGVTRLPAQACPRRNGKGETMTQRACMNDPAIKETVEELFATLPKQTAFLPTMIFSVLRPQTMAKHISDNKIASARLIQFAKDPNLLWQEQLNAVWSMETQTNLLLATN